MGVLLILFFLAMFLVGVAVGLWQTVKFLYNVFVDPKPLYTPAPLKPLNLPPRPPAPPNPPAFTEPPAPETPRRLVLTRAQTLQVLEAEARRAIRANALSMPVREELFAYIDRERARLPGASLSETPCHALNEPGAEAPAPPLSGEAPALPDVPAAEPAQEPESAAPVPTLEAAPVSRVREPAAIRAMIAKLHADAQAPEVPAPAPSAADAAFSAPFQPPANDEPPAPAREEARAGQDVPERMAPASYHLTPVNLVEVPAQPDAPHQEIVEPAERTPTYYAPAERVRTESEEAPMAAPDPLPLPLPPPPAPLVPSKTLAERLFTPENVRILQSIGIGIIFISAVAFVRMNMWEGASAWQQLALLLGGTAGCMGAGFALRRWTSLRITGLGFLILGQLAIVLDTYAALVHQGAGRPPLYPWAPSSLWMISMLVFSAGAWWHARKLHEPLFEAFTFFGALAAYGSGAVYAGVAGLAGERWWMMPAAYVPALAFCGIAAALMHARALNSSAEDASDLRANADGWRRWTLWWWMDATWKVGANLLTLFVPAAAVFSGRADLVAQYGWHAAALLALGTGLTFEARRSGRMRAAAAGALNLLAIMPLYAFAHAWPVQDFAPAIALPGVALALLALVLRRLPGAPARSATASMVQQYAGGCAAVTGTLWAFLAWQSGLLGAGPAALCSGGLAVMGVALALLEDEAWGAWAATAGASFSLAITLELYHLDGMWWPAAGLLAALALRACWRLAAREKIDAAGRMAANALAATAALQLGYYTFTVLPGVWGVSWGLAASWLALAVYLFETARRDEAWRPLALGGGVAALGPALCMSLYALHQPLYAPSPWLSLLALASQAAAWVFFNEHGTDDPEASATRAKLRDHVCGGAGLVLGLGVLLAIFQSALGAPFDAALAFALAVPAGAGLALRLRQRARPDDAWVALAELSVFACYSAAGVLAARGIGADETVWPLVSTLLGAGALFAALLGEALAFRTTRVGRSFEDAPFRATGDVAAFAWTVFAGLHLLVNLAMPDRALLLQSTWLAALVPLYLALRPSADPKEKDVLSWQGLCGGALAGLLVFFAGVLALTAQFWLPKCPTSLREACALYFGLVLAASAAAGTLQRKAFAPFTAALALLGLLGCAYGGWALPAESFGLACFIIAAGLGALAAWLHRSPEHPAQTTAASVAAGLVAMLGAAHLLRGLLTWPVGSAHAWGVAAWVLLAAGAAYASSMRMHKRKGAEAAAFALLGSLAALLGFAHALRWNALDFIECAPYLAGAALALLALREAVRLADRALLERLREAEAAEEPREIAPFEAADQLAEAVKPQAPPSRGPGVLIAALLAGGAAFGLGLLGWFDGLTEAWALTLLLEAIGLASLAVTARRDADKPFGPLLLSLELGAWSLLAGALLLGLHLAGPGGWLLTPAMVVLAGAVFFALGMAGEALAGALLLPERRAATPRPFLESRHLAGLGLAGAGALWAIGAPGAFADPGIHETWRALLGAGFLAAYAGMAEWSAEDLARRTGRMAAGLASHLLLIPGGYLCLLKAHSTGSPWGALWFLALAPLQLLAAHVLDREKHESQAFLARAGALLVAFGAVVLSFAGNAQRLAEVPCATFAALLAMALIARAANRGPERKAYALGALLALTGTVFFAVRVFAHDPAFGFGEMTVWEWPALSALGLLLILAGGATEWEPDAHGRSLAGLYGAALNALAAGAALYMLAAHGMAAHYLHAANLARFEAFIACLLLASGASLAAKRMLGFREGGYLAPVLALAGYALYVWTMHPNAWEWYTLPAAVLLFAWAKSRAGEDEAGALPAVQQEVSILLGLGCAAALVPSFAQALPYAPEALFHYYALVTAGLTLVGGAMFARRKIPLLSGSAAVLLGTLVKTAQWAAHKEVIYPVMGIALGFAVLAVGCLFESRMNRAIRQTVDRVRAEARMFWVSWE